MSCGWLLAFAGAWAAVNLASRLRRLPYGLELLSPLHLRLSTTALNNAIAKLGGQVPLFDGFYSVGTVVSMCSMVLGIVVLLAAAVQIAARLGLIPTTNTAQTALPLVLRPVIPGITLPTAHLVHYVVALLLCAGVHELGHAIAAARANVHMRRAGVFLAAIWPGAFVELSRRQLDRAALGARLRIVCAGVWHNAITAVVAWLLVHGGLSIMLWPGWVSAKGAMVVSVLPDSPLSGRLPLCSIVLEIDDIKLNTVDRLGTTPLARWTTVLTATTSSRDTHTAGFCAAGNLDDGLCCEMSPLFPLGESPDTRLFCFDGFNVSDTSRCFDLNDVFEHPRCQSDADCTEGLCVLPSSPFSAGRVLRILHRAPDSSEPKTLVYAGSPTELWSHVQVSALRPRWSWLPIALPAQLEALLQYVFAFSVAFCVLNSLPAYHLDGFHMLRLSVACLESCSTGESDSIALSTPRGIWACRFCNIASLLVTILLVGCVAGSIMLLIL
ncbi:hypothetical protein H4R20_003664 [Coemansia guatemalensis]|uniref:Endopeptidase S2P n=1 Tax=Coemansia guatemalensis TaxID=2761395 RepID=A0A9W8HV67_9FUNG|nr:hypothetical protein H4R20_003664 [Coemansia guatemalensis]